MTAEDVSITNNSGNEQILLKAKLKVLQTELNGIEQKIIAFETILRSHLENEIIEEQELHVLYKNLQKAKKEKRIAQKKRGKNFVKTEGLIKASNFKSVNSITIEEQKERKRLYREAMFLSHPDKFSLHHEKIDLATEITTKLIEIYEFGSLEQLQDFHAHIYNGNAFLQLNDMEVISNSALKDHYLEKEIIRLEKHLAAIKSKHVFKVLSEYENPLTFIEELKEYYLDRIFKLKKRTRNANKFI